MDAVTAATTDARHFRLRLPAACSYGCHVRLSVPLPSFSNVLLSSAGLYSSRSAAPSAAQGATALPSVDSTACEELEAPGTEGSRSTVLNGAERVASFSTFGRDCGMCRLT